MNDIAPASGWPFHTLYDLRMDHVNVARLLELLSMQLEILLGQGSDVQDDIRTGALTLQVDGDEEDDDTEE